MSSSSLTTLIVLVTVIHVAAFVVMIVIRVRRNEVDGTAGSGLTTPCAVCGEPATHRSYDGLDPNEQRDPHTGRSYSTDMAHYRPMCAVHNS